MPRNDSLTEEEFAAFTPNKRTIHCIETYREKTNLEKREMNVLDWGCGRGETTLWLKEQGYNVYGADIDVIPIRNGIGLFRSKGYDDSILSLITPDGKTDFPDSFFHFIFSCQVFEHISNLELVAAEMARVTMKDGVGFHIYPAHRRIIEGHLHMPIVHWLPKNNLRRLLIGIYVFFGLEPRWVKVNDSKFSWP